MDVIAFSDHGWWPEDPKALYTGFKSSNHSNTHLLADDDELHFHSTATGTGSLTLQCKPYSWHHWTGKAREVSWLKWSELTFEPPTHPDKLLPTEPPSPSVHFLHISIYRCRVRGSLVPISSRLRARSRVQRATWTGHQSITGYLF